MWLGFAVVGIGLLLASLAPAAPAAIAGSHYALGSTLIAASGVGMITTSPTVTELLFALEDRVNAAVAARRE